MNPHTITFFLNLVIYLSPPLGDGHLKQPAEGEGLHQVRGQRLRQRSRLQVHEKERQRAGLGPEHDPCPAPGLKVLFPPEKVWHYSPAGICFGDASSESS